MREVRKRLTIWLGVGSLGACIAIGCGAGADPAVFSTAGAGGGITTGGTGQGQGGAGSTGIGGSISVGSGSGTGSGGGAPEIAEVFGHSPNTLYRLDPTTKAVTVVGDFQACSGVIDIALDKDSNLFGTTFGGLYRIDKNTAVCTMVSSGSYPNSLSFVPEGTVDPNVEALVGYLGSTYVRIDTISGVVTNIGAIAGGYSSSGDIVSVKNGQTLLTVTGPSCGDCIVEIDPATGDMVKNYGSLGYGAVFGLAFWAGAAYGFSDAGQLFEVTFGVDTVTTAPIAIPSAPPGLQFWGAGSTTSAPPIDIPQ